MTAALSVKVRSGMMMFLQFFIWGAWYVTAYPVLRKFGSGTDQIKWTFSAGPIAAIVSPFAVGYLADRWAPFRRSACRDSRIEFYRGC